MKSFFKTVFASTLGFILGAILLFFISILIIGGIVSSMSSDKEIVIKENSILHFKPGSGIVERSNKDPFSNLDLGSLNFDREMGLNEILATIRQGSSDKKVKGMYLEIPDGFSSGFSTMQEIRDALISFRDSGKFIVAYADFLSEGGYYLASAADKIYLNPAGEMLFNGLYADVWFYKGALEKLGVEVQVFKHGKFKSAVEPFILDKLSPENRLQMERYVFSLYHTYLENISATRDIPVDSLTAIADELKIRSSQDALSHKMIDQLGYEDDVFAFIREKIQLEEADEIDFVTMTNYSDGNPATKHVGSDRIAVLYATGTIQSSGNGEDVMNAEEIVDAIREIRKDEKIKALVLRINSPGGSAVASDLMFQELKLLKEKRNIPIIVSMGDVAASGGYFIACIGDTIIAQKNTITGSIGVFGLIPNMNKLLNEKLGITVDGVKTGKYSDLGRVDRAMTPEESAVIQRMIDKTYEDFVNKVATNRNKSFTEIDSIAEGRVWTGADALNIGLVDMLGGMDLAMKIAAESCGLEKYRVMEFPVQKSTFENLFGGVKSEVKSTLLKEELGPEYLLFLQYRKALQMQGIQMRLPYDIHVN